MGNGIVRCIVGRGHDPADQVTIFEFSVGGWILSFAMVYGAVVPLDYGGVMTPPYMGLFEILKLM